MEQEIGPEQAGGLTGAGLFPPALDSLARRMSRREKERWRERVRQRKKMKQDRQWKGEESDWERKRGRGSIRRHNSNGGVTPQSQGKSHCNSVCLPHNVSVIATIIYGATTNLALDYCFPLTDMNYSICSAVYRIVCVSCRTPRLPLLNSLAHDPLKGVKRQLVAATNLRHKTVNLG